jgi:hypothetical protein
MEVGTYRGIKESLELVKLWTIEDCRHKPTVLEIAENGDTGGAEPQKPTALLQCCNQHI